MLNAIQILRQQLCIVQFSSTFHLFSYLFHSLFNPVTVLPVIFPVSIEMFT